MEIHFTDSDILMAEFAVPNDYQIKNYGKIQANLWLQAWTLHDETFLIATHNKEDNSRRLIHVTQNPQESARLFASTVRDLGYTDEQQAVEALRSLKNLLNKNKED